jgi:hypothetical protein
MFCNILSADEKFDLTERRLVVGSVAVPGQRQPVHSWASAARLQLSGRSDCSNRTARHRQIDRWTTSDRRWLRDGWAARQLVVGHTHWLGGGGAFARRRQCWRADILGTRCIVSATWSRPGPDPEKLMLSDLRFLDRRGMCGQRSWVGRTNHYAPSDVVE